MTYDTILFDLDGTLTDPETGITRSVQYALAKYNIEANPAELRKFIGPPLAESFRRYYHFDRDEAWRAVTYYREYFSRQGIFENRVIPGIPEMLHELTAGGKSLIVATSKPTVFSQQILDHFGLSRYFSLVAGSNLDGSRIDKAEIIRDILREIKPDTLSAVVMVGDREHDIIGAGANSLDSVGVTFGFGSREELIKAGATHLAETVAELKQILTA